MVFEFLTSFRSRAIHKDSYLANRSTRCVSDGRGSEHLGQEGLYRRTASPTTANKALNMSGLPSPPVPKTPAAVTPRQQEFHQSLLGSPTTEEPKDMTTAWEAKNKDLLSNSGSTSTLFTSDALKTYRRGQRISASNDPLNPPKRTPPEVAPKPKGHHHRRYMAGQQQQGEGSLTAAKSTPSLHNILNGSRLDNGGSLSPQGVGSGLRCWKNSLDSLDTDSTVSSTSPRNPGEGLHLNHSFSSHHSHSSSVSGASAISNGSNNNNNHMHLRHNSDLVEDAMLEEAEAKPDNWKASGQGSNTMSPVVKAKTLPVASSSSTPSSSSSSGVVANSNNNSNNNNAHSHSHSDSGLSSLSGRTSTISPVSTMSVSSGSSSSGGGSGNSSSRASLRSSSIVSQCTLPGDDGAVSPPESILSGATQQQQQPAPAVRPKEPLKQPNGGSVSSRVKFQEEIDCEELSKDFVSSLPNADDRLQSLLVPSPQQKTLADYVEGILLLELEDGRGQPQRKVSRRNLSPTLLRRRIEELKQGETASFEVDSSYDSDPMRIHHGLNSSMEQQRHGEELHKKKEELLKRISQKLGVLRAEQLSLKEEMSLNEELGRGVSALVHSTAKPNECVTFNRHVGEIEKITNLLLVLSGRLARTENAMASLPKGDLKDPVRVEERKQLENKRSKLADQLDEAKRLKESIDKRSASVSAFLHSYLTPEQFADYDHFVKMKAKLIMDSREIGDKIVLGEEQIKALQESLYLNNGNKMVNNNNINSSHGMVMVSPSK